VRLLLDTHAFLWWVFGDAKLSRPARHALTDDESSEVFVSAVSAWEIATKFRIGKLPDAAAVARDAASAIAAEGFVELPITVGHAQSAGDLGGRHRDPFDRMLIAQALAEDLTLVSNQRVFDTYGVKRLW
jgi:PIN domain nuclease of toxin-antitoxin system